MASVFGHALVAGAIGYTGAPDKTSGKFWCLAITSSILPDADVLAFFFGIPYDHPLGHRGFSHSLVFAVLWGLLLTTVAYPRSLQRAQKWRLFCVFSLITASHGFLDALTDGGLGVAFFSPFDHARYFLPWRPILVSPIGVSAFFSEWGRAVLFSELVYLGVPCLLWMTVVFLVFKAIQKRTHV